MIQKNKRQRIVICGATGFIGKNMLEYFSLNKKFEVIEFIIKDLNLRQKKNVKWLQIDLTDQKS